MKRESVLSDLEKESIIIEKLIFHIIIEDELKPVYLDEVFLDETQKEFFKKRLYDASQGSQFLFTDKTTSVVYKECQSIIEDIDKNFLQASKNITALFKDQHKKNMADGVFVVAFISISSKRNMIFLIKLDHKLVYRYKLDGKKATLEKIKNTFIEDKAAIQKIALIDMSDHYSWDLLAAERNSDGIREYFKKFLQVVEKDDAYVLTEKARSIARQWASSNKDLKSLNDNPSDYKMRAINYLSSHSLFNSDEYIDYVIFDDDLDKRENAKSSFKEYMEIKGLYGQSFKPSQSALSAAKRKNTGQTAEGLTLIWDGNTNDVNMFIPNEPDANDNLFHIEIKTSNISFLK